VPPVAAPAATEVPAAAGATPTPAAAAAPPVVPGVTSGCALPYWGKYVFHDNNRDINLSQMSMRAITDWYFTAHPPIMHDLHEAQALMYDYSGGPPQNPNLDPILFTELPFFANWELSQMTKWGMPGVYTHAFMDGWSPGYLGSVAYNHNGMMRMYETQSGREAAAGGAGRAVRCGLKINWVVKNIVNPAIKTQYPNTTFVLNQVVGIDATTDIWASRTGVRGANDLVWVGPAPNYAAKLTELDAAYPTWITKAVYDKIEGSVKFSAGKAIWEARTWTTMNGMVIYRSNWWIAL
jgi:class 3 adenylate cyclase